MRLLLTLFLLFLGQHVACAQVSSPELPYLIIPPHKLPDRFQEFEKQQIQKTVLKGCAKQSGYQVIIGDPPAHKKTKWQMYRVDLDIKFDEENRNFVITAALIEVRKNKVFNMISESNILEIEFFRRLEIIIDRLFLPPNYELVNSSDDAKKEIRTKKDPVPPVPESEIANINFRARIMDLKQDINLAISNASKTNKDIKKPEAVKDEETQTKKKDPVAAAADSGGMSANPFKVLPAAQPRPRPPIDVGHSLRLGYYSFNTASSDLIKTTSNPKYVFLDYEYARSWKKDSNYYHHASFRYGKTLNKEKKEFAPYTGFGFWEGYHIVSLHWMPKIGIEMDTLSFYNLPVQSQGLQVANNQIFWVTLNSVNNLMIFNRGFRFSASYGKPLAVKSGYQTLEDASLTGSKLNFTLAALNIYRKFHLEVNYFMSDLQAEKTKQKLTFSTTGAGLNAFYNF